MAEKRRNTNFKQKILRAFGVASIVGFSIAFIAIGIIEYEKEELSFQEELEVLANIFGNRSVAALIFDDKEAATKNISATRFHQSIVLVCLYDKEGRLFADYVAHDFEKMCQTSLSYPSGEMRIIDSDLSQYILTTPIEDRDEIVGYIKIFSSKMAIYYELVKFGVILFLVFILLLLIMISVARSSLKKIMGPLEELYLAARNIASNKQYYKRSQKISNDEVGELVEAFNKMLDSIAQEKRALIDSESRFRSLTDNSPVGVFQKDANGDLQYANDKWYILSGLEKLEDGKDFASHILDTYILQYEKAWEKLDSLNNPGSIEFAYRNPDTGNIQSFMEYVAPIYNADGLLQGYIGTLMDVSELKHAQRKLEKLAFHDPLTDLPNRRFFRDHLSFVIAGAKKTSSRIAIMMLDLDNFKKINDSLGHDTGDDMLRMISSRMRGAISDAAVVSRMGGDEFLFLFQDINAEDAANLAQNILDVINKPIEISGHIFEVKASIGVTMFPEDGATTGDLIKNADMALYKAKENGRNRIHYYSADLDLQMKENMRLESKLLKAISSDELCIYLQPQYSTEENNIVWAEALLRWPDKEEGFIPPNTFIPLAEGLNVIHKLGRSVIKNVCYQLTQQKNHFDRCGIKGVSINLSALEFFSKNFLSQTRDIIDASGIDPSCLEFELTESIVISDTESAIGIMKSLRDMGCRLSIDDFGTGYSSLSYLKRFPITSLKIDQSFVSDIPDDKNDVAICTAIIAMAHKLGLSVVAEGVETNAQRLFLIEHGCEYLQGYLIAKPANINDFIGNEIGNSIK